VSAAAQREKALRDTFRELVQSGLDVSRYPHDESADFVASIRREPFHAFYVKVRGQVPTVKHNEQGLSEEDYAGYLQFDENVGPLLLVVLNRDGVPEAGWLRALGAARFDELFKPSKKLEGTGNRVPYRFWPSGSFRPIATVIDEWRGDDYRIRGVTLLDQFVGPEPEIREDPRLPARSRVRAKARATPTVSVQRAAVMLDCSTETVRRLYHEGELEGKQPDGPGGRIEIQRASVAKLLGEPA
jgi:hypothetical protein